VALGADTGSSHTLIKAAAMQEPDDRSCVKPAITTNNEQRYKQSRAGNTMIRNQKMQRAISTIVLITFTSLTMYPLSVAAQAHDMAEKAGLLKKQKDEGVIGNTRRYINDLAGKNNTPVTLTADDKFAQLLADIHEDLKAVTPNTALSKEARARHAQAQISQIEHASNNANGKNSGMQTRAIGPNMRIETERSKDIVLKPLAGTDIAGKVRDIRNKAAEIKRLYPDIEQSFKDTEQHLKDAKLPQEIMNREKEAVAQYESRKAAFEGLMGRLDQATDSNSGVDQQAALADMGSFMAKYPNATPHQYTDPNKLPFGMPSGKVRAPNVSKAQYQASLFPAKYENVMLASLSLDGVKLAQVTLPEVPAPADTAETDDVQITQAIRDQAAQLNNNPVKIYNWVRNNISFIPSYGSIQGSDMTLQNKRGNAFDTASLLIALYRAAGIPARYVYGTIEVPADKVMNWVGGVTKAEAAQSLLGQGGIPNIGITSGGVIKTIRMEHVWVEAFVDNAPSRGAVNKNPNTWVAMDASFKQYQFTTGMDIKTNVSIDSQALLTQIQQGATIDQTQGYVQNLNQANLQSQLATYQGQVKAYVGNAIGANATVGDVLGANTIISQNYSTLLGSLPYRTVSIGNTFQSLPNNLKWTFKSNLYAADGVATSDNPIIELNQSTTKLAGKKITLSFIPATSADHDLINSYLPQPHADGTPIQQGEFPSFWPGYLLHMKAQFRVDGQVVGQTTQSFTMGSTVKQASQYFNPATGNWEGGDDNDVIVGEYNAIGMDLQGIGAQQIQNHFTKLNATKAKLDQYQQNTNDTTPINGLTEDDLTGDLVHTGILGYFAQVDISDNLAARATNKVVTYRLPSYGRFFTSVQSHYFFGIVKSISYPGVVMDVDYLRYHAAAKDDNSATSLQFMKQAGAAGSATEHAIPESMFRNPDLAANDPAQPQAVSAVKALAIASAQGQKIYTLNRNNQALQNTILQGLQISADVKSEIADALAAGREVMVHEKDIGVNGWTGSGYTILDPDTGAGAYKIAGGANGADMATTLLGGASGYLDGLSRFKDNWFNAGNAAKYARISTLLTVIAAIINVVSIVSDPKLSVTQKIVQIVINTAATCAMLGISEAIMGTALIAASNPILLGLLIATIAITLSILTMELIEELSTKLMNTRVRRAYV
jgi:hypothetical protein